MTRSFSILLLLLFSSWASVAQDAFLSVISSADGSPVEYAHVVVRESGAEGPILWVTDTEGRVKNDIKEPAQISISSLGFTTLVDSIYPGESKTIKLQPGQNDLSEVVVTAQYAPISEKNSVYKVKVLSKELIQSRGALTLNQVLNDQLNIRVTQDNNTGSQITMQGLGGANVKFLVDGIPLVGRLDNNMDLSQISLDDVERIEIIEGPLSVAYGSSALAGTINIITRKPESGKVTGSGKAYYESVGLYNFDLQGNYGFKRGGIKAGVGRNFFDGWGPVDQRDLQWNQKEQIFGNIGGSMKRESWNILANVRYLDEMIKDRGNRLGDYSNYAFDTWFNTRRLIGTSSADMSHSERSRSQLLLGYNLFWRSRIKYLRNLVDLSQTPTLDPSDHDTTVFNGFNARYTYTSTQWTRYNFQFGFDGNYETGRGDRIEGGTKDMLDLALFGSVKWIASPGLEIQPGMRYAYNSIYRSPVVPNVFIRWRLSDQWMARASYAQGFRAPSLKELYLEFVDANHNIFGNPDLLPERSHNVNIGFTWLPTMSKATRTIKVEPSFFFNDIRDNIILAQRQGTLFSYQNLSENRTFGAKLETSLGIHPDFSFRLGASYLGFLNQNYLPENGGERYLYTPEATFGFDYWRPSRRFNFNLTYKYTGKTPGYIMENGEAKQVFISDYNMLDISITQRFFKNSLAITLGGKNLFDVTNINSQLSSGGTHSGGGNLSISWGRTWFASLKYDLK